MKARSEFIAFVRRGTYLHIRFVSFYVVYDYRLHTGGILNHSVIVAIAVVTIDWFILTYRCHIGMLSIQFCSVLQLRLSRSEGVHEISGSAISDYGVFSLTRGGPLVHRETDFTKHRRVLCLMTQRAA
jgi:hypothetical protein